MGAGEATGLRWPSRSTALTPNWTLSLDRSIVTVVTSPTSMTWVQSGAVLSRHTTSYPARSGSVPRVHCRVESLVRTWAWIRAFFGVPGPWASDHSVAALTRVTRAM